MIKKKIILFVVIFLVLLQASLAFSNTKQLFGYYANWDTYGRQYQPADMPVNDLTAVIYAFAEVGNCAAPFASDATPTLCNAGAYATGKQDYQLYATDPYSDFNKVPAGYKLQNSTGKGNMAQVINDAHAQHKAALLSLGGYSLTVSLTTAMDSAHRATFIKSIVAFLKTVKADNPRQDTFDGVDIDWEPNLSSWSQVTPAELSDFVEFLKELKTALQTNIGSYEWLTIAGPANPSIVNKIGSANWQAIASAVDYINVMAYDYHGAFDVPRITNFQAPLNFDANQPSNALHRDIFNVHATLQAYLANGIQSNKLVLGFPAYGRAVDGVANVAPAADPNAFGLYQPFTGTPQGEWDDTGTFDYKYIISHMLDNQGGYQGYDIVAGNQYIGAAAFNSSKGYFISYDDVKSIIQAAQYTKQQGLAGMMEWELSGDLSPSDANYENDSLIHQAAVALT